MNIRISREWRCKHACFDVVIGGFTAVFATAILFSYIPPAWAVSVPIGNLFVVDLGDLPPWIGALVALAIWWDAHQAKKKAAEAVAKASVGVAKIEAVAHQIDGLLAERDKTKVREGEAKGKQAGVEAAEQLAEGQRQGRDTERESVAAATAGLPAAAPLAGKQPLPVADDRTGAASDRVAQATERLADATEVKLDKQTKTGD